MDQKEWNGSGTIGGVCEDYLTQRGLSKDLHSCSSSGGGLSMRAFYHTAFTASVKNEMAVNILSREKQRHKRNPGSYCVRVTTYSLSE